MKTFTLVTRVSLIALSVLAVSGQASAMDMDQMKRECFRLHHQLVDKPALKNVDACWRAHSQMMSK